MKLTTVTGLGWKFDMMNSISKWPFDPLFSIMKKNLHRLCQTFDVNRRCIWLSFGKPLTQVADIFVNMFDLPVTQFKDRFDHTFDYAFHKYHLWHMWKVCQRTDVHQRLSKVIKCGLSHAPLPTTKMTFHAVATLQNAQWYIYYPQHECCW